MSNVTRKVIVMEFEKSKLIELKEKFDSIINTKEKEPIVPVESQITFNNGETLVTLPANSVVAIIADLQ